MRSFSAAIAAALLLAAPTAASASQRSGDATDPVGDSSGFPSQDIKSATAQYDTDGDLIVAARMNGDLKNGPSTYLQFRVAEYVPPSDCTGEGVTMAGFSDDPYDFVQVDGTSNTGSMPIAYNGNDDIVFAAQGSALANKGYSCMTLYVQQKGGGEQVLDQLDVPLWFDGYGPHDPPPPPPPPPPPTSCKVPNVKGKSLAAAKKAIAKAHCQLGKVTQPKHPKKGQKLVVTRQSSKGSKVSLVLGPKPRKR
jgi:hypothetical protein